MVPREGPNLQMQGAVWEIRWVVLADNNAAPTGRRCHDVAARRNRPAAFEEAIAAHGIPSATSLGAPLVRFHHSEETAVYDKYVRWYGRTGSRGPSYPIGSRLKANAI
jgi:hypothetical protein